MLATIIVQLQVKVQYKDTSRFLENPLIQQCFAKNVVKENWMPKKKWGNDFKYHALVQHLRIIKCGKA